MTLKSDPCHIVEADQEEASLRSAMAISTPLVLLLLPILASTLQGDAPDQPGGGALQWVGFRFQTLLSHSIDNATTINDVTGSGQTWWTAGF